MKLYTALTIGLTFILGSHCVVDHREYVVPYGQNGASVVAETSSVDFKPGAVSKSISFSTHSQDGGYGSGPGYKPKIDTDFYGPGLPRFQFPNFFEYQRPRFDFGSYWDDDGFGSDFDFFKSSFFNSGFRPFASSFSTFSRPRDFFFDSFNDDMPFTPPTAFPFPQFGRRLLNYSPHIYNNYRPPHMRYRSYDSYDGYRGHGESPYDFFRPSSNKYGGPIGY